MAQSPSTSLPRRILLALILFFGGVVYGFFATNGKWAVADAINAVRVSFQEVYEQFQRPWYMSIENPGPGVETLDAAALAPGLVMIAGIDADERNFVRVIDRAGNIVHQWRPSWFDIWAPGEAAFPEGRLPQREPGAVLHGVVIADNGDLLVNYEHLSTVRLDACGRVVWKLANLGHHFITPSHDGTYWVGSERLVREGPTGYPNHAAPFNSWSIQQISAEGEILREIEIAEVLQKNDLFGLMLISATENDFTTVWRDTAHLNDADIFPPGVASQIFAPGDIMVSLRNMNTVLVFDPDDLRIKFRATGEFLRQHDPDFAPDDRILVYDNNNMDPTEDPALLFSRITEINARTGARRERFRGQGPAHFYAPIMGRQQALANGNLMLASPGEGRALEVGPDGRLLWQYHNLVDQGFAALLTEANVLPEFMDMTYFQQLQKGCGN